MEILFFASRFNLALLLHNFTTLILIFAFYGKLNYVIYNESFIKIHLHLPLLPTPGAPITATLTSHNELFFLLIPLIAFDVILQAFVTAKKIN